MSLRKLKKSVSGFFSSSSSGSSSGASSRQPTPIRRDCAQVFIDRHFHDVRHFVKELDLPVSKMKLRSNEIHQQPTIIHAFLNLKAEYSAALACHLIKVGMSERHAQTSVNELITDSDFRASMLATVKKEAVTNVEMLLDTLIEASKITENDYDSLIEAYRRVESEISTLSPSNTKNS